MNDSEVGLNTEEVEGMSLRERAENDVYQGLFFWIKGGYRDRLADLLKQKGLKRDIELADLGRDFAWALWIFSQEPRLVDRVGEMMKEVIFGTKKNSVVNCLGEDLHHREKVKSQLLGPISILTFADLIQKTRPEWMGRFRLSEVVAEGDEDVRDKVDLKLRGKNGRVKLIQLKSIPDNRVRVARIEEPRQYLGVSGGHVARILARADQMRRLEGVDTECFVVLVPQFDTRVVGNVFGIINDTPEARELVENFRQEGELSGLLPPTD